MINEDTMTLTSEEKSYLKEDKHILIAMDDTDSARRALLYVADFLGGYPGIRVTLLRVIRNAPCGLWSREKTHVDFSLDKINYCDNF